MTKIISVFIIVVVIALGWLFFNYWEKVQNEKEDARKKAEASVIVPERLAGMPYQLETSLKNAQSQGPEAFGEWLKAYGPGLQDPRKAWIELDYCMMLARKNPREAKRLFAAVKQRTPPKSPVAPRIHDLAKTFE